MHPSPPIQETAPSIGSVVTVFKCLFDVQHRSFREAYWFLKIDIIVIQENKLEMIKNQEPHIAKKKNVCK